MDMIWWVVEGRINVSILMISMIEYIVHLQYTYTISLSTIKVFIS